MGKVNPSKTALVLGAFAGGWHIVWALMVALGWAQMLINFVLSMHFLAAPVGVQPFQAGLALILVIVTAFAGYGVGFILGVLWNWIHK